MIERGIIVRSVRSLTIKGKSISVKGSGVEVTLQNKRDLFS